MNEKKLKSWFLGPQAENADVVERLILEVFRDHVYWRRNFHPEDGTTISQSDKSCYEYLETIKNLKESLYEILNHLKIKDVPFFSPRYIGHMTSDLTIPSLIGYISTIFYDPNNVSSEASPYTTKIEIEVGKQLGKMVGYNEEKLWGHITSGGTVANIEALWVARNLKYFPLAVKKAAEELKLDWDLTKKSTWELLNFCPDEILSLREKMIEVYQQKYPEKILEAEKEVDEKIFKYSLHRLGFFNFMKVFENELKGIAPPVIIVPRSKHYSLVKAAELLGIGSTDSLIYVDLKEDFTIDKDALEGILTKCKEEKRVVIAVVGVIGTTEEGAIDDIKEIDELRKHSGISFWLHADAAWGGYLASILWGENEKEINDDKEFVRKFTQVIGPDREVNPKILNGLFKKLKNLSLADSITIDPHKLGYIPYPCGGIVFKDKRIRDVICFHAPYIFHIQRKGGAEFIGRYILEGSKPGASAVACYLSHKVIPLNWSGYGYLMAMTIKAANFINAELKAIKVNGIKVVPVFEPQSNLVNFVVNFENNRSLKTMNTITDRIYKKLSIYLAEEPKAVQLYENLVSKTEFHFEEYGDKPILKLLKEAGIIDETDTKKTLKELRENNKIDDDKVSILRMTCMNPFLLAKKNNEYYYIKKFIETLTKILKKFSLNIFAWEDEEKEYNNLKNMVENIAQEETIYISLSPDKDLKSDDVIERIKKMEDIPDLFIIDLMEKRDPLAGVRVIKAIKSRDELKEVPILIYTKLSTEDFKTIVAPALKRAGWEEDEENKVVTEKNRDKIFREMIKRIYEKGD